MSDERYPTLAEFWERLDAREVEADLRRALHERAATEGGTVTRVGQEATVVAVAARVLPGAVPAATLAAFLDAHYDEQLGRGDERVGLLPRGELIPAGFAALEALASERHSLTFVELDSPRQDELLLAAEGGDMPGPDGFDSAEWFVRVRDTLLLAYGADPRGMVQMGYPGPSYRPGHIWLDLEEVRARANRKPGYQVL